MVSEGAGLRPRARESACVAKLDIKELLKRMAARRGEPLAAISPIRIGHYSPIERLKERAEDEAVKMSSHDIDEMIWDAEEKQAELGSPMFRKAAAPAHGIPNPEAYGDTKTLTAGELVPYVLQLHEARRRGPHYDFRIGPKGMLSWVPVGRKRPLPPPGQRVTAIQQPAHAQSYKDFEGEIQKGYGAGRVTKADSGEALILHADDKKIKFVFASKKDPEEFTLIRLGSREKGGKPAWFMFNTTPNKPVAHRKVHYKKIPAEKIDQLMDPKYTLSEKIDGAAAFLQLMEDKIHVLSYRARKGGEKPIIHTYRMGLGGKKFKIPSAMRGMTLRGEIYGERGGKAIPSQELGGILNATLANSLRSQKDTGTRLRMALFGLEGTGTPGARNLTTVAPHSQQRETIQRALTFLPSEVFHEPAYEADKKREFIESIRAGKNPRTHEGVVGFPEKGKPVKHKFVGEHKVHVREVFPGAGKLKGVGAGGFHYSLTPKGPIAGKVGTGFSAQTRKDMLKDPDSWVGRTARVRSQAKFPSGALRAPAFVALSEDYPRAKAASGEVFLRRALTKCAAEEVTATDVEEAGRAAEAPKSPEQAEAGNYKHGHIRLHGMDISIENAKGSTRSGVAANGKAWSTLMKHSYGYIKMTESEADGDHIDVFIGDHPESDQVFVVDQENPASGRFDEHKCMLGFLNLAAAKAGYLANYDKNWKGLGAITPLSMTQFKKWLDKGKSGIRVATQKLPAIPEEVKAGEAYLRSALTGAYA